MFFLVEIDKKQEKEDPLWISRWLLKNILIFRKKNQLVLDKNADRSLETN